MASELMDIFYIFIPILLLLSFCIYVHNQRKKTILTLEYLVKVLPAKIMITLVLHFCLNVNSNYQESNRTKKKLTVYKCSMDGKDIVYAKAYFIFSGIHGNNFVISRVTETKISDCLMLIISLTCNNSLCLFMGKF